MGDPCDPVGSLGRAKDRAWWGRGRTLKGLECSLCAEDLAALGTKIEKWL